MHAMQIVPFFKKDELEKLKAKLPCYVAKADDVSDKLGTLE